MSALERISDVFRDVGQPTITYVERNQGKYERDLRSSLNSGGQLALITGPSKTGKTTLYKRVLHQLNLTPLIVRCDDSLSADDFWKRGLERAGATQLASREKSTEHNANVNLEAGGRGGWRFIAELFAKAGMDIGVSASDTEIRQAILAIPNPSTLLPILKATGFVLIIEDFHYLRDDVKTVIFQQWKNFIDDEISIAVVGTTHRAVDIAYANKDLVGRINQIDVGRWETEDLKQIVTKGFVHLEINCPSRIRNFIATESVGLPIITQQVCLDIFLNRGIEYSKDAKTVDNITFNEAGKSLNHVAQSRYAQLEHHYSVITRGPRRRARKYETYELFLTCFTLDPLQFSLERSEIDERLRQLPILNEYIPPSASINAMLGVINKYQKSHNIELLEWRPYERKAYILEPAFLFFLRWRIIRAGETKRSAIEELFRTIRETQLKKSNWGQLTLDFFLDFENRSSN